MQQQKSCPRCTVLNHVDNDECTMCAFVFRVRAPGEEGRRHREEEKQHVHIAPDPQNNLPEPGKTPDLNCMSVLETLWIMFMGIVYTLYAIIVTWTAQCIFEAMVKVAVYVSIAYVLYALYYIVPFAVRKSIDGLKWMARRAKENWSVRTHPLMITAMLIIFPWLIMLTLGYRINMETIRNIQDKIADIEIDVTVLQTKVVDLTRRVTDVEVGLRDLQKTVEVGFDALGNNVKALDDKIVRTTQEWNQTYSSYIEGDGWIKKADTYVRETMYSVFHKLSSKTITRQEFGLGCFMQGTKIQVDEHGTTVNVEELKDGDYVYSPALGELVKIKVLFLYGEETGNMYEITTHDGFSVVVTETHPMKICRNGDDDVFDCRHNIAAKDVLPGNWTVTLNGYAQIESVEAISVENALVYNFMLDVADDVLVTFRDVMANGIVSLDLEAQKRHHSA